MNIPSRPDVLRSTLCAAALAALLGWLLGAAPAHANTLVVTSKLDVTGGTACTLRDAITAANTNTTTGGCVAGQGGPDLITFSFAQCNLVPCAIVLNSPLPKVTEDLTIDGAIGSVLVTINGSSAFRIFELGTVQVQLSNLRLLFGSADRGAAVQMASSNPGTSLLVSNVFFANNHAITGAGGGAIDQPLGALNVVDSHFESNSTVFGGGAIARNEGPLRVSHSSFISNTAGNGGAIFATGDDTINVSDSLFDENIGSQSGGALMIESSANVTRSTFVRNRALATSLNVSGGALGITSGSLTRTIAVTISDSAFFDNFTARSGGAMAFCNGRVLLSNVTVSGNSAKQDGGGIAIRVTTCANSPVKEFYLNNVTLSNNTADSDDNDTGNGGGMIANSVAVTVTNSLIAGNFDTIGNAGPGTKHPDCSGTFISGGFTLIGRSDGCAGFSNGVNGDKAGTFANPIDALLGVLADNGGPTLTHALLDGSPARNAGNPVPPGSGGFACAATDQRGMRRPLGLQCDMGAYEAGSLSLLPLLLR